MPREPQTEASPTYRCQIQSIPRFAEGVVPIRHLTPAQRARLVAKRWLPMKTKRQLKRRIDRLRRPGAAAPVAAPARTSPTGPRFEAGQHVRVRPREEIEATLDSWGQLRGCGFMPEMAPYCGTTQRVLKPVRQFVDERDYKLKKARGVYLLEGLLCEGTELFGRCDRGCLYFWREEWLEPASDGSG